VAERLKAHAWKACLRETVTRVRIPLSPPPFALRASGGRPDSVQGEGCLPKLMWYVYFLELKNGDVYVGSTNDLRRRVHSRQSGHVASTSSNLPVVLHSYVDVADETTSRQLERYFKSGSSKAFAKKRFLAWLLTRGSCRALYDRRGLVHSFEFGLPRTAIDAVAKGGALKGSAKSGGDDALRQVLRRVTGYFGHPVIGACCCRYCFASFSA
jgi:putative endonuclease